MDTSKIIRKYKSFKLPCAVAGLYVSGTFPIAKRMPAESKTPISLTLNPPAVAGITASTITQFGFVSSMEIELIGPRQTSLTSFVAVATGL